VVRGLITSLLSPCNGGGPQEFMSSTSYDGGYQQYMIAPVEALVPIPDTLSDT